MASLRVIKKDVDYLITEVISDAWLYMYFNPEKNREEAQQIIQDTISFGNDISNKVNNPDKENTKKFYKELNKELLVGIDTLFVRISALNK